MTEKPNLADKIFNTATRAGGFALAGSLVASAAAQQPPADEPQHDGAPVYDSENRPLVDAYAEHPNLCPPDMVENIMTIGGKEGIALFDSYLGIDTKKAIFGTDDLTDLDIDTISMNLGGSEVYLVSADREIVGRIAFGRNIGDSFQSVTNGEDFYLLMNPRGQTSELSSSSNENGLVEATTAQYGEVREALCALRDYALENGGTLTVVGTPDGALGPASSSGRTAEAGGLEDVLRSAGFGVPAGPVTQAPSYNVGSSLTGHAVSAEFSIDDVLSALPIGEIEGYGISFEPGKAAVSHDRGAYTIVAALGEDAGTQEIAKLVVGTADGAYEFPITANAMAAADEYAVALGSPEDNQVLNEFGVNMADNHGLNTFSLENETRANGGEPIERAFETYAEAAASESRRGYRQVVYDPQDGTVIGRYEGGSATFEPTPQLSPLLAAIERSNNAEAVGLNITYNDGQVAGIGVHNPYTE